MTRPTPVRVAGLDVDEIVRARAAQLVAEQVDETVRQAIAEALTPEALADLGKVAKRRAEAQLAAAMAEEPDTDPEPESEPQLLYGSVAEFVEKLIVPLYRRRLGGQHFWLAEWWRSAEATARLEAMWRAFEHLRLDGALGQSAWLRDHADYHMGVLLSQEGPGGAVETPKVVASDPGLHPALPVVPPPPGLFVDERAMHTPAAGGGNPAPSNSAALPPNTVTPPLTQSAIAEVWPT